MNNEQNKIINIDPEKFRFVNENEKLHDKKFDDKHPFSDELTKEEINSIRNSLKTNIIGHFYVINADIAKIASVCHDNGFEPVLWITGTDRFEAYSKQDSIF